MSVIVTKPDTTEFGYNLNQLQTEINAVPAIAPSCLSISLNSGAFDFEFAVALSVEEEAVLETMIENHVPDTSEINITELPISADTNKLAVQSSAKPMLDGKVTYAVWAGAGDDMVTGETGDGELLDFTMTTGVPMVTKDVRFHPDNGRVWINEAYIRYENAGQGDWTCGIIMAPATQLQQLANLDLIVEDNLVKFAPGGPGTGTHGFAATPALIPRTASRDGDWDYDGTDLTPNMTGTGAYRISDIEQPVHKFVTKIPCRGTTGTYFNLASDDTAELMYPYFIRVAFTNASDTNWNAQVFLEIYREKTIK